MTESLGDAPIKFTVELMHVECIAVFKEPCLALPTKAIDLLSAFYRSLHPRYSIDIKDLQTAGGTSFGDVKLSVSALNGLAQVEVTPLGMACDLRSIKANDDDFSLLKEFMSICDGVPPDTLPNVTLQRREVIVVAWLKLEGGKAAAAAYLRRKGDASSGLGSGQYKEWRRSYSLSGHFRAPTGVELAILIEESASEQGDLFAKGTYAIPDSGGGLLDVNETLDMTFTEFEELLKSMGLKHHSEAVSQ